MTHKTTLTAAAAVVILASAAIVAAAFSGSDQHSSLASFIFRSPRSSADTATGFDDTEYISTGVKLNSRLRASIVSETAALNEKFGESQVKLARRYVQDMTTTIQTKIWILESHRTIFNPENKNGDQLAKMLFGEFSETLDLSHEQSESIKKSYSKLLNDRISNLTRVLDQVAENSAFLTEFLLYADAHKTTGMLPEAEFAKRKERRGPAQHLVGLADCNEFYVSPSILDESRMSGILSAVLNPQQEEAFREELKMGSIKLTGPIQPVDTAFILNDFESGAKLEDISKKMADTRQEMDRIFRDCKGIPK